MAVCVPALLPRRLPALSLAAYRCTDANEIVALSRWPRNAAITGDCADLARRPGV